MSSAGSTAGVPRGYDRAKRALDLAGAGAGLILALPVMAVVAGLVALNLGRPVLFRQERPGRNARVFRLYKFRTMQAENAAQGLLTDEQRLTRFGRALRSTSLDELPTLWNVLTGDMSVVGPRPLLVRYLDRYTAEQSRRHEVRPGVTGLAQASGRNALTWPEKFELDVYYVDHRSLSLDARILLRTARAVFARAGVTTEGGELMPEFGEGVQNAAD